MRVFTGSGMVVLLLAVGSIPCLSALSSPAQVRRQEAALRARVEAYFGFLKAGNSSKAENYVTRDTLDTFRNEPKTPFQGFSIDSIKMKPDGRHATVQVSVSVVTPYSNAPFPYPRDTDWRLVRGVWYVEVPKPASNRLQAMFRQPSPGDVATPDASPPMELEFKNHIYTFLSPLQPGEVKIAHFVYKNVSNHVVTLGAISTGCKCLRLKSDKKEFMPGESGSLDFEVDPEHHDYGYGLAETMRVTTEPGDVLNLLTVRTYVAPLVKAEIKGEPQK
jgi:Protein of unknown function (DUF1573)